MWWNMVLEDKPQIYVKTCKMEMKSDVNEYWLEWKHDHMGFYIKMFQNHFLCVFHIFHCDFNK